MGITKKVFTNKTYGAQLYKWSPEAVNKNGKMKTEKPFYCAAFPGSQGQDWVTSYCYNITVVDGQQGHSAYVECDYVE